jgi:ATP-binding cassette subfamily C (CFTR/MRP) protein 1
VNTEKEEREDEKAEYGTEKPPVAAAPSTAPAAAVASNPRSRFSRRPTGQTPTHHRTTKKGGAQGAPKYDRSLLRALHTTFWVRWWSAGAARLISDTLKTTSPLVNKQLLAWLSASYAWRQAGPGGRAGLEEPRSIGYGIGMAFVLFAMQELASLIFNHYLLSALSALSWLVNAHPCLAATLTTGLSVRTAVIGTIFRKALRLSGRARVDHSAGQITTMISTDCARLDRSAAFFHQCVPLSSWNQDRAADKQR